MVVVLVREPGFTDEAVEELIPVPVPVSILEADAVVDAVCRIAREEVESGMFVSRVWVRSEASACQLLLFILTCR